jgi:ubiquinone biosynthesis protein COQ4
MASLAASRTSRLFVPLHQIVPRSGKFHSLSSFNAARSRSSLAHQCAASRPEISSPASQASFRLVGRSSQLCFSTESKAGPRQSPPNPFISRVAHLGPLSTALVSAGAALVSLADPSRADMVALLGELTAAPALRKMREQMLSTEEGQQILKERPRIREGDNIHFPALLALPSDTFGFAYASFMTKHGFSPNERHEATCIANIGSNDEESSELAYVLQRYRECHDMWHSLAGLPPSVVGEAAVKWLEMVQTGLPMASLAALASPLRMSNAEREVYLKKLVPWASRVGRSCVPLMAVRYERLFELPLDEVRKRLRFEAAPVY